jgi:hypothetical protein
MARMGYGLARTLGPCRGSDCSTATGAGEAAALAPGIRSGALEPASPRRPHAHPEGPSGPAVGVLVMAKFRIRLRPPPVSDGGGLRACEPAWGTGTHHARGLGPPRFRNLPDMLDTQRGIACKTDRPWVERLPRPGAFRCVSLFVKARPRTPAKRSRACRARDLSRLAWTSHRWRGGPGRDAAITGGRCGHHPPRGDGRGSRRLRRSVGVAAGATTSAESLRQSSAKHLKHPTRVGCAA